jgi:NAD(P)-dependent dehydrogenase (short-subunit alcohol dehydrogenase family)
MTRFTTHFGFQSTAAEVIAGVDLTRRKAIVTGGAAGIGAETVRALAGAGAAVTMAVRRVHVAEPVAAELRRSAGNQAIDIKALDLSDLRSVKAFTDTWEGPLDILVNNAGIMAVPELEKTPQDFELQFGTNFLGHFALTIGLHTALAAANGARVVSLSSTGHLFSPVIFDDLNFDFVPYTPIGAYGQSKTADALLAVGITQRWANDGIRSNTLHPGAIATGLQKYTGGLKTPPDRRKTPEQGASTSVLLAASPLLEGISGLYFEDCNEAQQLTKRPSDFTGGYAGYALDPEKRRTAVEFIHEADFVEIGTGWPGEPRKTEFRKSIGPVIKFDQRTRTARSHSRLCLRFQTVGDRNAISVMCQFRTFAGALGDAIVRDYQALDVAGTCLFHQLCASVTSAWDSSCPPGKICCSTAAP